MNEKIVEYIENCKTPIEDIKTCEKCEYFGECLLYYTGDDSEIKI